jgi:hypothetical protein
MREKMSLPRKGPLSLEEKTAYSFFSQYSCWATVEIEEIKWATVYNLIEIRRELFMLI